MERFEISVTKNNELLHFEIANYMHHNDRCKFEVFKEGKFIAAFEPDHYGYLHVCKNPGELDEDTLHLIADRLEASGL